MSLVAKTAAHTQTVLFSEKNTLGANLIFDKTVLTSKATTIYIKCTSGAIEVNVLNMHDRPDSTENNWHWAHIPAGGDQYFRADTNDLSQVRVRAISVDSVIDWCTVAQVQGSMS